MYKKKPEINRDIENNRDELIELPLIQRHILE